MQVNVRFLVEGGKIAGALFAHIIAVRTSPATLHKYWLTGSSFVDKKSVFFSAKMEQVD